MIWLASFPRSGNTFFRNVLFEVYGIESSAYHHNPKRVPNEKYASFEVVKTHLLPSDLPSKYQNNKSVYIVRDGRDALVSIAHHRKDIIEEGTLFYPNLESAILAVGGSYFGGWSKNVKDWTEKADIVIRFEDLITDPIREIEKLRTIMDLPEPDREKLPNFKNLKFGKPKYGGKKVKKHFRRGKVGGWKDELPRNLHRLFWDLHGEEMVKNDFTDGMLPSRGGWLMGLSRKRRLWTHEIRLLKKVILLKLGIK